MDRHFDEELSSLKQRILQMGDLAEEMVSAALNALINRDPDLRPAIAEKEKLVNQMQIEIDENCLKLIALHQPTAIDLRFLLGVAKINAEFERVGDHAINVSRHVAKIFEAKPLKPFVDLPKMLETALGMFKESIRAFVDLDIEKAKAILLRDDMVDNLRDKIVNELIEFMSKDSSSVPIALHIIMLANNIEKIADHATNIAEIIIFVAQGKDIRHHSAPLD
jgi:phosphate transport system protein